jgi:hypothetical protein
VSFAADGQVVLSSDIWYRELKEESYGVELLNAIGRAYEAKASQHMVRRTREESLILICLGILAIRSLGLVPWRKEYFQYCHRHVSVQDQRIEVI